MPAPLRLINSITELQPADEDCIAVSGSHGGISSAGIAGLEFLQSQGLAACAVAHTSACIGVAQSTLDEGVISHANAAALLLGVRIGHTCSQAVAAAQAAAHNKETSP